MGILDRYNLENGSNYDYPAGPIALPAAQLAAAYNGATAYTAGQVVLYNGSFWIAVQGTTGNAPGPASAYWQAFNSNVNPGAAVNATFSIINDDFDGIDLMAYWTGPFLAQILVANVAMSPSPVHGYSIFSNVPGQPQRLFLPMRCRNQDTVQFNLQDISGSPNVVYITVRGVQLKRQN